MDIFSAARKGDLETVKRLMNKGADVNALDEYGTPAIYYAAWHGKLDVLEALLKNGADVNKTIDLTLGSSTGRNDWTALHAAAAQDNVEGVVMLLNYGANINATSSSGRTALFGAMDEMDEFVGSDVAKILIGYGANVNLIQLGGQTLLYKARLYNRPDLEKLLVEAGATEY